MPKPSKSRRTKKARVDRVAQQLFGITTPEQILHGVKIVDVANHTEADQRHSIRSKETRTIRKLTPIEKLERAGLLTQDQALVCAWYAERHELGFHTVGQTANYAGAGGAGPNSFDLLARYKDQAEAREDYQYARQAIPQHLLGVFEGVVLGNSPMPQGNDRLRFNLAVLRLYEQVGHLFGWAA